MRPLPRYDRGVSNVVLDWHRSEVRPWRNDKLELSVPLEPEPDSYWKDALQTYELQARRERAGDWRILRPGTDPYMHHVPDVYEALIVENIEPRSERRSKGSSLNSTRWPSGQGSKRRRFESWRKGRPAIYKRLPTRRRNASV